MLHTCFQHDDTQTSIHPSKPSSGVTSSTKPSLPKLWEFGSNSQREGKTPSLHDPPLTSHCWPLNKGTEQRKVFPSGCEPPRILFISVSQHLTQDLAHSRCLINACWMNEWTDVWSSETGLSLLLLRRRTSPHFAKYKENVAGWHPAMGTCCPPESQGESRRASRRKRHLRPLFEAQVCPA